MAHYDVLILGAGGAGMMCGLTAAKRKKKVAILDHNPQTGAKILISGGGRCNFTNLNASAENYFSHNKDFCKSALARFSPQDFLNLVKKHKIAYHEKKLGQLFCSASASNIVDMLKTECELAGVEFLLSTSIKGVSSPSNLTPPARFEVQTSRGPYYSTSLVIATGGLSVPKVGATDLGYRIAKSYGISVTKLVPALDGFILEDSFYSDLSGLSLDCNISCNGKTFRENILFTHKGLSGPAALQASLYWNPGDFIEIDLFPDQTEHSLMQNLNASPHVTLKGFLARNTPKRFADAFCKDKPFTIKHIGETAPKILESFVRDLKAWRLKPKSTVGYQKAEVTRGGVDTHELSSQSMEATKVPGLYFIGEVVDVTGWLGGYNFQWAWASGYAAGISIA